MPVKIRPRRSTQRPRKNSVRRKNKQAKGRKRPGRPKPKASRVIANSVFALTLQAKPGFEVQQKSRERVTGRYYHAPDEDDFVKMYHDIGAAFRAVYNLTHTDKTRFDPLKAGLPIGPSMASIINAFKRDIMPLLPGFEFDIERDGDTYMFVVHKPAEFAWTWPAFEIKYIVTELERKNPKLLSLFLAFMDSLINDCGIPGWWQFDESWRLEEQLLNMDMEYEDINEEECIRHTRDLERTIRLYKTGRANDYEDLLRTARNRSVSSLEKSLKKFSKRNPLVSWLYEALEFLKMDYSMHDFEYRPEGEEAYDEGLPFGEQSAVIWDWEDLYTNSITEMLDATAQGTGVLSPVAWGLIKPDCKAFNIEKLINAHRWPPALIKLQRSYNALLKKYYWKREEKKSKKLSPKNIVTLLA